MSRRERGGVAGDHVRVLVLLDADPVPDPVDEGLAVPGVRDEVTTGRRPPLSQVAPTTAAPTPRRLSLLEDRVELERTPGSGSPVTTVRVMSEQ